MTLPMPDSDKLEREKFEFEKEKWESESQRSRWTNPFMVAIIGAIAIGLGNAGVSILNAKYQRETNSANEKLQRELADKTNQHLGYLESVKAENSSILEVVKLGDVEKVRAGLCLLLKVNSIKSDTTHAAVQSYLANYKSCDDNASVVDNPPGNTNPPRSDWITVTQSIPGCGISGCYADNNICGPIPPNTRATGNVRNSVDSFAGAWGDWRGSPTVSSNQFCRIFQQHSHNVMRTVSYQFEVVPAS